MSASSFRRDAFGGLTDKQYNNRKSFPTVQIIAAFLFAVFFGCRVSGEKNGII